MGGVGELFRGYGSPDTMPLCVGAQSTRRQRCGKIVEGRPWSQAFPPYSCRPAWSCYRVQRSEVNPAQGGQTG